MKLKLVLALIASTLWCSWVNAQIGQQASAAGNPTNVSLSAVDSGTCSAGLAAIQQLPLNAGTSTVTLTGTFSATVTVRLSANGGSTWVTQGTQSSTGTVSYSVAGFTFICVDPTTYSSGIVQVTINSSLASGSSSGSGASNAAPNMAFYFTNACQVSNTGQCFFTSANTQLANDCTWSNASTTLTCATSHFVAGDVGKRVAGYFKTDSFGSAFGCVAGRISFSSMTTGTLTIASVQSGTQVTLSGNPSNTATGNNGCFIWGTPDDANASTFETSYAAISAFCPKVMLAAAGYWFSSPHFSTNPTGCLALPSLVGNGAVAGAMVYTAGFELEGRGPGNTVIYLGPDFPNGDPCTRAQGNITNACFLVPVEGKWSDFQLLGGGQLTCQVPANKNLIGVTVGTLQNLALVNFCEAAAGGQIGIKADLLTQIHQVNSSGFGNTCLQTVANEPYVQAFKLACENSPGGGTIGASVDVMADGGTTPTFTCWGCLLLGGISVTGTNNIVQMAAGSTVRLIGGVVANCEAGSGCVSTGTALVKNSGGNLYMTDVTGIAQGGAALVGGINCAAASSNNYLERTTLANIANANYGGNNAGCKLYDLGGNGSLYAGIANNGLLGSVIADGRSLMFSCTGVANASVTNSLYGSGPNITATTCAGQTSTLGTGIPFQQARTIAGIIATSSATTVSVAATLMVNGSATSTTCTMTAATRCNNFTTTAVNPGDLLSVKIVTGAAETGANIQVQALWQ